MKACQGGPRIILTLSVGGRDLFCTFFFILGDFKTFYFSIVKSWGGVLDAETYKPSAPQPVNSEYMQRNINVLLPLFSSSFLPLPILSFACSFLPIRWHRFARGGIIQQLVRSMKKSSSNWVNHNYSKGSRPNFAI